jgi:hypothetical protein
MLTATRASDNLVGETFIFLLTACPFPFLAYFPYFEKTY